MKFINYVIALIISIIAVKFLGSWAFNHIDPWAGIAVGFVGCYAIGWYVVTKIMESLK